VLVTGGLGPTHDDVTMEAVAGAFGRDLVANDQAADWLAERGYSADDLVAETTHLLPADCRPLANEAGVAPGAVVESVYVLPGVPAEMEAMFESVVEEFEGTPTHTVVVDVDEPESELLERFTELQETFDVTVGSYPGERTGEDHGGGRRRGGARRRVGSRAVGAGRFGELRTETQTYRYKYASHSAVITRLATSTAVAVASIGSGSTGAASRIMVRACSGGALILIFPRRDASRWAARRRRTGHARRIRGEPGRRDGRPRRAQGHRREGGGGGRARRRAASAGPGAAGAGAARGRRARGAYLDRRRPHGRAAGPRWSGEASRSDPVDPFDGATPDPTETTADHTARVVEAFVAGDDPVDLVLFVGGDGTATDVATVLERTGAEIPMLGVPAGVKVYSSVFAVSPEDAAAVAATFSRTERREVMDIDEDAYREGRFTRNSEPSRASRSPRTSSRRNRPRAGPSSRSPRASPTTSASGRARASPSCSARVDGRRDQGGARVRAVADRRRRVARRGGYRPGRHRVGDPRRALGEENVIVVSPIGDRDSSSAAETRSCRRR